MVSGVISGTRADGADGARADEDAVGPVTQRQQELRIQLVAQRAGGAGADENNTLGGENNIDGLFEQLIELVIIDAFKKAHYFAGADICLLRLILLKI